MTKTNATLFLTLKVFSATGGIEKVCRVAGKAMYEESVRLEDRAQVYSMYDKASDAFENKYFPTEIFRGFGKKRIRFIASSVSKGRRSRVVILSHINLLLVGWLIKFFSPQTRLLLYAHGIEIWGPLSGLKKKMLKRCDELLCVSRYTADVVQEVHGFPAQKIRILNNCLDPFMPPKANPGACEALREKYGFSPNHKILFTLTRLSSKERYKGYDLVLKALADIHDPEDTLRYLIAGSYDQEEKIHLDQLIQNLGLQKKVTIAGFIADESLVDHFSMADLYIMPSMKEGFGIVFIEAMQYGLPVIGGNKDGSVDALRSGELGVLVDPQDQVAISNAIIRLLASPEKYKPSAELLHASFGYEPYQLKLASVLQRSGSGRVEADCQWSLLPQMN